MFSNLTRPSLTGLSRLGVAVALLAVTPALAGGKVATTEGRTVTITIGNFTFTPREMAIAPGTTVTWVNHDDIPHTVVETNTSFRSKALDTDDTFSLTFAKAGEYSYFCSLHPHMTGRIVVKADPG
jgi:plastocyanin